MKQSLLLFAILFITAESYSQLNEFQPDLSRALFHTRLDKAQKDLLAMDGKADNQLKCFRQRRHE
jgi:hypothetical protein